MVAQHLTPTVVLVLCVFPSPQAPVDEKTKTLLVAAVGLIAAAGAIGAGKATVDALQNRITAAGDQVTRLVIGGAFWLVVFVAARFILEL
jgi:hypothetical protein